MKWREVISFFTRLFAVVVYVCVLAIGASRLNLPSVDFWRDKTQWVVAALVISSLPSAVQTFLLDRGERRRRKALEQEDRLRVFLTTSLVDLAANCGLDWKTTGVRVFVTKKKRFRKKYEHDRVALVKLNSGPPSGIKWVDGKGIVGQCWESNGQRQFENFDRFRGHNQGTWNAMGPRERFGMTFDEVKLMRERYGVVAAVPIVDGTKYLGCVTMDTEPTPTALPDQQEVWHSLGVTAAFVKTVLDR
jgi:hypothetical protein